MFLINISSNEAEMRKYLIYNVSNLGVRRTRASHESQYTILPIVML